MKITIFIKNTALRIQRNSKAQDYLACAVILLLTLAFWHEIAFMGSIPILRDINGELIPWRIYARQSVLQGEIPLWNPYSHFGQPFLANPLTAVFYPLTALFYLLPLKLALNLYIILHFLIAGIAMYFLMRCWKVSSGGALISAITFSFSGWMVANVEFFSFAVAAWTPLIVMLIFMIIKKPRLYLSIITGLIVAMQTMTTNPQNQVYTILAAGLIVVIFTAILAFSERRSTLIKVFGLILLAGCLSFILSAIQLLPTIEFANLTARGHISAYHGMPDKFSLHPAQLVMLLVPNFFGYANWQKCFYVGIVPLMLCFLLFSYRKKRDRTLLFDVDNPFSQRNIKIYLFLLLVIGTILSMGHYIILADIFMAIFPFLKSIIKWPSLSMYLSCFALAGLAGFGFESVSQAVRNTDSNRPEWKKSFYMVFPLLIVDAILILVLLSDIAIGTNILQGLKEAYYQNLLQFRNQTLLPETYSIFHEYLKMLVFLNLGIAAVSICLLKTAKPFLITAMLIILTFMDLFVFGSKKNYTSKENIYLEQPVNVSKLVSQGDFPQFRVASWLRPLSDLMYGNRDIEQFQAIRNLLIIETSLPWRVFKLFGWRSMLTRRIDELEAQLQNPNTPEYFTQNLLSLFNVKHVLAVDLPGDASELHTVPEVHFIKNSNYLSRAFIVYDYQILSNEQEIKRAMALPGFNPGKKVILEKEPDMPVERVQGGMSGDWSVNLMKYTANTVTFVARTNRNGILFISDTYYPGWHAYINGKETKIIRANYAFRAIIIPPGEHSIKFIYAPESFTIGKLISGIGLVLCMVLGIISCISSKQFKSSLKKGFL